MSGLSLTDWIRRAVIQEGLRIEVLLLHIKKEPVAWKRLGVTPEELEEVAGEREAHLPLTTSLSRVNGKGWKGGKNLLFWKTILKYRGFFFPQICFVL